MPAAVVLGLSLAISACSFATLGRVTIQGHDATPTELSHAQLERGGKTIATEPAMPLERGDTITSNDATVVLRFAGAEATLMPGTKVTLGSIWTWFGEVFFSGWLGGKSKYATAAVQGTEYVMRVDRETNEAVVAVFEGKVRVSRTDNPRTVIVVMPGQQARVSSNSNVPTLEPVDRDSLNAWLMRSNAARGASSEPLVLDVRGLEQERGTSELQVAGFQVQAASKDTTDPAQVGHVIEQTPPPGSRATNVVLHVGALNPQAGSAPGAPRSATVELQPKEGALAGSAVAVSWTGPTREPAIIAFVPRGADVRAAVEVIRANAKSPVTVPAPIEPGDYDVRYLAGGGPDDVLASVPYRVSNVEASIEAPGMVKAGADFQFAWNGPNFFRDRIHFVPASTAESKYFSDLSIAATETSPATLRAPSTPGEYELRYALANRKIITRTRISVAAVEARLIVSPSTEAGAPLEVSWSGPGEEADVIGLVPHGTDDTSFFPDLTIKANAAKPATLQAPAQPGTYELRYTVGGGHFDKRGLVVARTTVEVTPARATLKASTTVVSETSLKISWSGPCRSGDKIYLVPAGTDDNAYVPDWAIPADSSGAGALTAPDKPGEYELRYVLGGATFGGTSIIARHHVTVLRSKRPAPQR